MIKLKLNSLLKIAVWGHPGSGKTTLAVNLSLKLNHTLISTDKITKIYEKKPYREFVNEALDQIEADKWVLDGNLGELRLLVLSTVNLVIILNLPILITIWRLLTRTLARQTRFKLTEGNTSTDVLEKQMSIKQVLSEIYILLKMVLNFKYNFYSELKFMTLDCFTARRQGKLLVFNRLSQIEEFIDSIE